MYIEKIADFIKDVDNDFQKNIVEVLKANKSGRPGLGVVVARCGDESYSWSV